MIGSVIKFTGKLPYGSRLRGAGSKKRQMKKYKKTIAQRNKARKTVEMLTKAMYKISGIE